MKIIEAKTYRRRNSILPKRLTVHVGDDSDVELKRLSLVGIGRKGSTIWQYSNEDGRIRMAFAISFNCERRGEWHQRRDVMLVSANGPIPPNVGAALAEVFVPDEPIEVGWEVPPPGWLFPMLTVSNTPAVYVVPPMIHRFSRQ